jgi:Ti-type conjugative transfer relaxase TraA
MAIYHFSAKVITRTTGRTALGAAAYRSGEKLEQDGIGGVTHDYTRKSGVVHREILAPDDAPEWSNDRAQLWNEIDRTERRKDGQLAREIEVALPVELTKAEQIELLRTFAKAELISRGMIADVAVHHDNPENPHAHIMLTLREIGAEGFGDKQRDWNEKPLLRHWREAWASTTNEHLAMAGHEARVDHRSHHERGITLQPGRKIGIGVDRQESDRLPEYLAERVAEQRRIARENGERIASDPVLALASITYNKATFTERDVAKFLHTRTDGAEQFQDAMSKVMGSAQVVQLPNVGDRRGRYTTREMVQLERQLFDQAVAMKARRGHVVSDSNRDAALQSASLSIEQRTAFAHVTGRDDLSAMVGVAGSGKSTLLSAAREAWENAGFNVKGAALSGIAAENLQRSSGVVSRTLASFELAWKQGRDELSSKDVLIIDEAAMVGTRQMSRVLNTAHRARAKVVLVGDPEQLQAIEAGAPFRGILSQVGAVELTEARRQRELWQRDATRQLATGNTEKALEGYEIRNLLRSHATSDEARTALLQSWSRASDQEPNQTRLILAYTRNDVAVLNDAARELRKSKGELQSGTSIETSRGEKEFAPGDRLYFLRNERSLGVKNGSLATVNSINDGVLKVSIDGLKPKAISVDTRLYNDVDHGYATTIHKSQGSTVDRAFVLASPYFDRHTTYVSLSRHRESAEVHFAKEDFHGPDELKATLSRARPKELALDFIDEHQAASFGVPVDNRDSPERGLVSRFQERVQAAFEKHRRTTERDDKSNTAGASMSERAVGERQRNRQDIAARGPDELTMNRGLER